MKRFLPSNVMLIPFVVKHYPNQDECDEEINEDRCEQTLEEEE